VKSEYGVHKFKKLEKMAILSPLFSPKFFWPSQNLS